jgi:hypothetical protein
VGADVASADSYMDFQENFLTFGFVVASVDSYMGFQENFLTFGFVETP